MPELLSGVVSISLWAHGQRKALTLPNLLSWGKSPTTKGGRPLLPKGWLVWMLNAWALVTMVHLQATEKAKHSWPAYATLSTRACRNLREEGKGLSQREPKRQQTDQWQKKKIPTAQWWADISLHLPIFRVHLACMFWPQLCNSCSWPHGHRFFFQGKCLPVARPTAPPAGSGPEPGSQHSGLQAPYAFQEDTQYYLQPRGCGRWLTQTVSPSRSH